VIEQARAYLKTLETFHLPAQPKIEPQLALFEGAGAKLLKVLEGVEPDALSPKDALELIYKLKRLQE
jgi:DNA mismatch repair protein MutS